MNILAGFKALGPVAARGGKIIKAKAPTLLMINGIVCGVSAAVTAVKRSPLCEQAREEFENSMELAEKCLEEKVVHTEKGDIPYDNKLYRKDVVNIYVHKYVKYGKVYLPAFIFGAVSISSILWSHGIMMRRTAALTATISSISKAFNDYRRNVREQYGNEADYNMMHGYVTEKEKVTEKDPETGKTKTVTKEVRKQKSDSSGRSGYSRCFDEAARNWTKDASTNKVTLMGFQTWANEKLRTRGYLFLNEVYELFGFEQTLAGSEMGWIFTKDDEDNIYGDNRVDFGFDRDPYFMEGSERSVWLDFNVDELPIRDRIRWARQ